MNYATSSTPSIKAFSKGTCRFLFLAGIGLNPQAPPAGAIWTDLGNCLSSAQKHNAETVEYNIAEGGVIKRISVQVTAVKPEFEITLNEVRIRQTMSMRVFGVQNTDAVQVSATALTQQFAAVYKNSVLDLGKRNVLNVVVKIGSSSSGTTILQDTDYQLNAARGTITIMDSGSVPDSTQGAPSPIFVTFDCPALTRSSFTEYSNFSVEGLLRQYVEDAFGVMTEKIAAVSLRPMDPGADDGKTVREDKVTAVINSNVLRYDRKD